MFALDTSTVTSYSRSFTLGSNVTTSATPGTSTASSNSKPSETAPTTTEVFTLTKPGLLVLPEGHDYSKQREILSTLTFTGPTVVTAPWVQDPYERPVTYDLAELYTSTFTVDQGTLLFDVGEGTTYSLISLVGPTTATIVASRPGGDYDYPFSAYDNTADPACVGKSRLTGSDYSSFIQGHAFTAKSPIATLSTGQVLTTVLTEGGFGQFIQYVNRTFTGPTTVYSTVSEQFLIPQNNGANPIQNRPQAPGLRCGGGCGICRVFFQVVYVHYWPVEKPNTACLDNNSVTPTPVAAGNGTGPGVTVHPRGLSKISADATTVVSGSVTL